MSLKLLRIVFVVSFLINCCLGLRELTATYLSVKVPHKNWHPSAIYDGGDLIYLWGGPENSIFRFHISTKIVEPLVDKFPNNTLYGTVHSDSKGNIFYFSGHRSINKVYKFDPHSKIVTTVATLSFSMKDRSSFKLHNGSVYLMANQLTAFDLETGTINAVGTLKFNMTDGAGVPFQDKVFLFGSAGIGNRFALELSMDTLEMERVGPDNLPIFASTPTVVTDGEGFIYILGGYQSSADIRTDGIYQFNVHTYENHFIPVASLTEGKRVWWRTAPRCAFVQSSNRIYCFGGQSLDEAGEGPWGTYRLHEEIFYIDLTPLFCRDRSNGKYPHPTDSDLYIDCYDGHLTLLHCSRHLCLVNGTNICEQSGKVTPSTGDRLVVSYAGIGWIIFTLIGSKTFFT